MDFKKDKVFAAVIGVLAVVLLAGVGLCVYALISNNSAGKVAAATERQVQRLASRGNAPALTEKNVATAEANKTALEAAIAEKTAEIRGRKGAELVGMAGGDANAFFSSLRESVNNRTKKFQNEKIAIGNDAAFFGFSRYLQNTQSQALSETSLAVLATEQNVLRLVLDRLEAARAESERTLRAANLLPADKRVFLLLKEVRREAAELAPGRDGSAAVARDELSIDDYPESAETGIFRMVVTGAPRGTRVPSLRREGMVNALAFQVGFIAPTSVLRGFLDSFSGNGDYPIFVRDVAVVPASEAEVSAARQALEPPPPPPAAAEGAGTPQPAADDFSFFNVASAPSNSAAAPAAELVPAAPEKFAVQPETLSTFLVTFEYVSPLDKPAVPAEADKEE